MSGALELKETNRHLRDLVHAILEQNRTLKALNHNLIEIFGGKDPIITEQPKEPVPTEEPPYIPKMYGWSVAGLAQREGTLQKGDIKIEEDESRWVWTGEGWERIEVPSVREE